jgi:endonuclease/exonuclease/phosphatase family metal-dependent hydrolase
MQIKVLSFNIWDLPLFFVKNRKKRFEGLIKYLKEVDADIICLQEAFDVKHRAELREEFKIKYSIAGNGDSRKILFVKVFDTTGGLMVLSKFPIKTKKFVPYSRIFNSAIGEVLARKGFLDVVVETPKGDLRIVNTHLHEETPFFDRAVRLFQLKKILGRINNIDLPAILVGDFNQQSLLHQKDFSEHFDLSGFAHPLVDSVNLPTYRPENIYVDNWLNRTKTPKRFDYILTRRIDGLGLKSVRYEPQHLKTDLSDHDPLLLVLSDEASAGV